MKGDKVIGYLDMNTLKFHKAKGNGTLKESTMPTSEFIHYHDCNRNDPDHCGACALTIGGPEGPNYSGWPLAYMENRRPVPAKWRAAFEAEFLRTDNDAYVANLKATREKYGVRFTR